MIELILHDRHPDPRVRTDGPRTPTCQRDTWPATRIGGLFFLFSISGRPGAPRRISTEALRPPGPWLPAAAFGCYTIQFFAVATWMPTFLAVERRQSTADQWRGDCLSALGHPCVRTPNLDRLAGSGVLFTRHYSQATPCSPGRASLYTGLYLHNHRVVVNGTPLGARHTNVALEARKLGYEPALFGYTDTGVDPGTRPPATPICARTPACCPA